MRVQSAQIRAVTQRPLRASVPQYRGLTSGPGASGEGPSQRQGLLNFWKYAWGGRTYGGPVDPRLPSGPSLQKCVPLAR